MENTRKPRVILDPGHFVGYKRGAIPPYAEGTAMYNYAQILAAKLRAAGCSVGITRQKVEDNPGLWERGKKARGADLFLSLHSNGVDSPDAMGVTIFYSIKRPEDRPVAAAWAAQLAGIINGGTRDRGAHTRKGRGDWDYYTVIQSAVAADCPHVLLVEHGFHSHPGECRWLMQAENLERMADLETRMACDLLGLGQPQDGPQTIGLEWVDDGTRRKLRGPGGIVCSQWQHIGGSWFYLMADGTLAEGWARVYGAWHYFHPAGSDAPRGAMAEGWLDEGGHRYYLAPHTGRRVTGCIVIDGVGYVFGDTTGQLIAPGGETERKE